MAKKNSAYYDSLVQRYRELAKKADQRLLRLERLSKQKHFKHVKEWAYQNAMKSIHVWDGKNATRFNTAFGPLTPMPTICASKVLT